MSLTRFLLPFRQLLSKPNRLRPMDFQASVTKLHAPVKDLVLSVTQNGTTHVGAQGADAVAVNEWIDKIAQGNLVNEPGFKTLDAELVPKTYLVSNYLTAADVALYGMLHPTVSKLKPSEYFAHPSVTRYFDHVQSAVPVRTAADALSFAQVTFELADAPRVERKVEPPKKKEKKVAPAVNASAPPAESTAPPAVESAPAPAAEAKPKKEKKEKKEKGCAAAAAEDSGEPVPSMIDLRVGHIVDIMKHPDADGLYVEQIDLGEETGPRTVVSGLVHYIPIEQMRDKYLVAVCNLKPASMRGVKSFAMVLCATSKDGKEAGIELIQPPANSKPGDRVYFEGGDFESATPLAQLNPKKKIFETIQPGFITLDSREAAWVNPTTKSVHKIRTKEGVCVAPTLVGASLS
ncbi:hypothetical protein HMN09_01386500 [Mycena chlorophos]|uniref:tRNA-binding domain-containing protein n=1 Tax=Mycena chlorophos TaxID=658473 RepID=A0A8H6RWF3_MYCCL|nr:hypothetical protein HMN09_01386500 [Mycena chlorophos]